MNFFTNSCSAIVGGVEVFNARFLNASKALFFCCMVMLWGGSFATAQSDSTASLSTELRDSENSDNNDGDNNDGDGGDDNDGGDNGNNSVAICHQLGNGGSITIYVNESAVPAHLNHGDALGACDGGENSETPCTISLNVVCPEDVTVECGQEANFEFTGTPGISGEFCSYRLNMTHSDQILSCSPCGKVISRTWVIWLTRSNNDGGDDHGDDNHEDDNDGDDDHGDDRRTYEGVDLPSYTCTQIITSMDTQGPEIYGLDSELSVQCIDEIYYQDATAADGCSGESNVSTWRSQTGEPESRCVASTAFGPGADWAIWLPTLSSASGANFVFNANGGHFDQFADGSAHFYGTVVNTVNADEQFIVDLWFEHKAGWAAWSAQGRNFKNDLMLACATNGHVNWNFYELVGGFSTMTGAGALAGDVLYMYHMPNDYYFGFQIGEGANNKNCANGMSGWFTYEGFSGNEHVSGHGDVNVDLNCVPVNNADCIHHTSFTNFYRAVDACGHATIASQQINVNDETAPVFSNCPEDMYIECSMPVPAVPADIEATDNCSGDVTVSYLGQTTEGGPCYSTITRTWSATDICGNRSNCVQVIYIQDTTAPVLNNLPQGEITVECDAVPAAAGVTISDNCDMYPSLYYNEQRTDGDCPSYYTLTRTWYGYDHCENYSATYTQTIYVQDTTAPEFDAYEFYAHIECTEIPALLTAHDNCSLATVVLVAETLNSGGCLGVLHRTYRATDECNNSSEVEQYISIMDTTAPEFVGLPNDTTLECSDVVLDDNAGVTGIDNCGHEVVITYSERIVATDDNCPESYDIIRTWIATDYCDNQTTATRTTRVQDTTDPYFTYFPMDMTISCDDAIPPVDYARASDNCDSQVQVAFAEDRRSGDCPQSYSIIRTFRAYDNCGNDRTDYQTITVVDEEAPLFEEQSNTFTYECNTEIPVVEPSVSDNCSEEVSLSYSDIQNEGTSCHYSITRVWTAMDSCNNSSQFEQTLHIWDTTAPVITGAMEINRPCDDYNGTYVQVTDNCNEYSVFSFDVEASGSCAGKYMRHYYAIDYCENISDTFIQVINLTDLVAPVILSQAANDTIECGYEYSVDAPEFADNCDQELEITTGFYSETDGCTTTNTYTWTAKDHCNNSTTATTVITIVDTTNPYIIGLPENVTINCDQPIPGYGNYRGADNCSVLVNVAVTERRINGSCPQSYRLERTYRATDACGNQAVELRYVDVVDIQAPSFGEQAAFYQYECGTAIPVVQPVAIDNCDDTLTYSYQDGLPYTDGCISGFNREWTAADDCGNASTFNQSIRIVDTTAPVVNPYTIEVTMPCDNVNNAALITATDCHDVIITFQDEHTSGACGGRIIRTYQVSDECGNRTAGLIQQIITLIDNTAPVVEVAPADTAIQCGDAIPDYTPVWSDNCDDELTVSSSSSEVYDNCTREITQRWSAEDHCHNITTVSRIVTIIDTDAPYFLDYPADENYECSEEFGVAEMTAYDACSHNNVTITHNDVIDNGNCPANYVIYRTFRATDRCGNYTEYTQTIQVSDNYGPIWGENTSSFVYECGSEVPVVTPIATDLCSTYSANYQDGATWTEGCNSGFSRTWTAEDACGNPSESFVQHISFEDNTAPTLSGCPQNLVLACNDTIPAPTEVTAYDSCDEDVQLYFEEKIHGDGPAEGSIADCDLITPARAAGNPCGYPYDWSMAMFNMPTAHRWYKVVGGNLVQYPGGSLHLVAQLENVMNPGTGWNVDVNFSGGMDWAAWSTQGMPTSFKADCGAEAQNFASWTYFLLQAGPGAELQGYGAYQGSMLNLVHAPANNYFGFQLGDGANNYNGADNGFGGWFSYSGVFRTQYEDQLQNVSGAGDWAFELDCCPDYTIERTWTAIDCSGNMAYCSQTISFDSSVSSSNGGSATIASEAVVSGKVSSTVAVSPNPANSNAVFTFKAAYAAKTSLEVLDMTGKKVADIFMGTVEAGASYNVNFNVGDLATGVYTYRLINGTDVKIDRLIINK